MIHPTKEIEVYEGIQKLYRFPNDYGASVVKHKGSYGYYEGLWELAVLRYTSSTRWVICYDTPVTDDVIGYLTEEQVQEILQQIEALPSEE